LPVTNLFSSLSKRSLWSNDYFDKPSRSLYGRGTPRPPMLTCCVLIRPDSFLHPQPQQQIQQQPHRADEEGSDEAWDHKHMVNADPSCIPHFPASNKQIEGKIVNPAGQHHARILKNGKDLIERSKSQVRVPMSGKQTEIQRRERDNQKERGHSLRPFPARQKYQ